jgi:hypothetical protein
MRFVIILSILLLANESVSMAISEKKSSKWTVDSSAGMFVSFIGEKCLTDSEAMISYSGNTIEVYETASCTADIKNISKEWGHYKFDPMRTYTGSRDSLQNTKDQITIQYAKRGLGRPHFLGGIKNCKCLTLVGKDYLASKPSTKKLSKAKREKTVDYLYRKNNPGNNDLIMDYNSMSFEGATQPLLN